MTKPGEPPATIVRQFVPELWPWVRRFSRFYDSTYNLQEIEKRALAGVATHLDKALVFRSLADRLRPNMNIDREELNTRGFSPALHARDMAAVVEAAILEAYSSIDCVAKVLYAIYGKDHKGTQKFKVSTSRLFKGSVRISATFPAPVLAIIASADWYRELLYFRSELAHLATGSCHLEEADGPIRYMHTGINVKGSVLIIDDIFSYLDKTISHVRAFGEQVFEYLYSLLNQKITQQLCGIFSYKFYQRFVAAEPDLTSNSGYCMSYSWFEKTENEICPYTETCGAYARRHDIAAAMELA